MLSALFDRKCSALSDGGVEGPQYPNTSQHRATGCPRICSRHFSTGSVPPYPMVESKGLNIKTRHNADPRGVPEFVFGTLRQDRLCSIRWWVDYQSSHSSSRSGGAILLVFCWYHISNVNGKPSHQPLHQHGCGQIKCVHHNSIFQKGNRCTFDLNHIYMCC